METATAWATIVAALLAALGIFLSAKWTAQARRDLAMERRRDFELDLLVEVADLVESSSNVAMRDARFKTRLEALDRVGLDLCRARYRLPTTPRAESAWSIAEGNAKGVTPEDRHVDLGDGHLITIRDAMRREVAEAIRRRVAG